MFLLCSLRIEPNLEISKRAVREDTEDANLTRSPLPRAAPIAIGSRDSHPAAEGFAR
jgi:hypothetical protein